MKTYALGWVDAVRLAPDLLDVIGMPLNYIATSTIIELLNKGLSSNATPCSNKEQQVVNVIYIDDQNPHFIILEH